MKHTDNIYNDFEMWKHKDIYNLVERMKLNSIKDSLEIYNNTKINLNYELWISVVNELDQRQYKFNFLHEVLNAAYFIHLLIKKEGYTNIEEYKIFTAIIDSKNKTLLDDITDNFMLWDSPKDHELEKENKQLKEQLKQLGIKGKLKIIS